MKHFLQKYTPELLILAVLMLFFAAEWINQRFWLNDFRVYYSAAEQFVQGNAIYGKSYGLASGFYKYSPFALLFFIPFTLFSFQTAAIIYFFVNSMLILFLFYLLKNVLQHYFFSLTNFQNFSISLVGFIILGNHFFRELHLGNTNALLLLGVTLSILFLLKQKKIAGGILLACCILFKPHFFILVPIFVLRKEYTFLISFGLALLAGLFLPAVFIGMGNNCQLLTDWLQTMSSHNSSYADFENTTYCWIQKVLETWGISISGKILFVTVVAIAASLFFGLWLKHCKEEKKQDSVRNRNFLIEYFLLTACIPSLTKTDTEHFLFSMPIILFLLGVLFLKKLPAWNIVLIIIGFLAYGGNWHDLVGNQISSFWNNWGLLGIGNWILIGMAMFLYEKNFPASSAALSLTKIPKRNSQSKPNA